MSNLSDEERSSEERTVHLKKMGLRDLVPFIAALLQTSLLPFLLIIVVLVAMGVILRVLLR